MKKPAASHRLYPRAGRLPVPSSWMALAAVILLGCASPESTTARAEGGTAPPAQRAASPPAPRTPDAVLSGFQLTGDYLLEVDGEELPRAKIYETGLPALLLRTSSLPTPVVLIPRAQQVQQVPITALAVDDAGSVDIAADAELIPSGGFAIEGQDVVFSVSGHQVRLKPRPWLLGANDGTALADHNPVYARLKELYQPDAAALEGLQGRGGVQVRVFFGSWCPACKNYVPGVLKVEEVLGGEGPSFDYYGLPSPFKGEPEATRLDVVSVPTGIVYVDGREVGRLDSADDWHRPEVTIRGMLGDS